MSRIDDPPIASLPLSDRALPALSELNQDSFLRLKLSLSLNLRRQVFLAICDDLALRNALAARLSADLAQSIPTLAVLPTVDGQPTTVVVGAPPGTRGTVGLSQVVPLISLDLDFANPNPIAQITQWVKQATTTKHLRNGDPLPSFQILGIEGLTRKSAGIQKRFLDHLQHIGNNPTGLDSSLILWLTRPWFRMVQSSAPAFWQAHTALFQFEGDPTPAPSDPPPVPPVAVTLATSPRSQSMPPRRALWELLADDLEQFDEPIQAAALEEFDEPLLHLDRAADRVLDVAPILLSDTGFVPPIYPVPSAELAMPTVLAPSVGESSDENARAANGRVAGERVAGERVGAELTAHAGAGCNGAIAVSQGGRDVIATDVSATDVSATDVSVTDVSVTDVSATEQVEAAGLATEPAGVAAIPPASADPTGPLGIDTSPAIDRDWVNQVQAVVNASTPALPPAIATEILRRLQEIEQLHQQGAQATDLAIAYRTLGNLCRDGIEQGSSSEAHLRLTIRTYEHALTGLEIASPEGADVLNDMGNLYWMLSRQGPDPTTVQFYLDQGIAAYNLALAHLDPQAHPHSYAMLHNNLGSAYGDLARYRDPAVALQQAVQAYAESLRYRSPHEDPARYAATQNNLGTAYWNLAQHEQPVARLQQAIAAYMEALRYYSPEREPLHYAMIQNNLGTAYWNLAQQISQDKKQGQKQGQNGTATEAVTARELLLHAITVYRDALTYRTLAIAPSAHAATQNNLGTAFWNLAILPDTEPELKQEALEWAIATYTDALTAIQQLAQQSQEAQLTFDRYATHNNLGLAHYHLATAKQSAMDATTRSQHLEAALQNHLQALSGWAHQPDYATTATSYIIQTVRAFYTHFGMKGQSIALSQIPASLLPELMRKL